MMKILGGRFGSRMLEGPPEKSDGSPLPGLRPYSNRVKESVFNLLRGWFEGAHVLDLFAGVGTIGLECVSRGADRVVMIERDRRVYKALKKNIESLDCAQHAEAIFGDALSELSLLRAPAPLDLVFVDPPFSMMTDGNDRARVLAACDRCAAYMKPASFLVLRSPIIRGKSDEDLSLPSFLGPEVHEYRRMQVMLYQPDPSLPSTAASGMGSPNGPVH